MSKAVTPKFRVAYPNVFKPRLNELSKKMEFSVVALFKKGEDLSGLEKIVLDACVKKWGADKAAWPKKMRNPFRDQGDREKLDKTTGKLRLPDGYEAGAIYLNLRSTQRPGLVDSDMSEIIDETQFYGGCYARAEVAAYAYDTGGNCGVNLGLNHLQKMGDGDHFGARGKAEDAFSPVESQDESSEKPAAKSATSLFD